MAGVFSSGGRLDHVWMTLRSLSIEIEIPVIRQNADTMSAFRCIAAGERQLLTRSSTYAVSVEMYRCWSVDRRSRQVPLLASSLFRAVRSISKMAFQQAGLVTSPCPVPRSAVKDARSWVTGSSLVKGWWIELTQLYGRCVHMEDAWGVRGMVGPSISIDTR